MKPFGTFYLDKEKDIIVDLFQEGEDLSYVLRTPNHKTGNLITNLARLCGLPLCFDSQGLKVIRGQVPCYIDDRNRAVYILRLGDTKAANIYPDGTIERKASIPAIAKTLMSQTKDYRLGTWETLVKTYIPRDYKFRTDLHTHMNANLDPDILIALGISHQIRYPLYYIKKLRLRCTEDQKALLEKRRRITKQAFEGSPLQGKYLTRRIDDNTFINFADFILADPENALYNLPRIRASLAILKDGQAVFSNLEKVYLYRYVFTKGQAAEDPVDLASYGPVPDREIAGALARMQEDDRSPAYQSFSLFQDKLLWIARGCQKRGICYIEISDTGLVKSGEAPRLLGLIHAAMPAIYEETGVVIRFLASFRRIPLTIVRDQVESQRAVQDQVRTLRAIACDPYVAGSDIIGEEINDIRELRPLIRELTAIAGLQPGFVVRIHAGENDSLRDNVAWSLRLVKESLAPGQPMPPIRIGHGLYTANLNSEKGRRLMKDLREAGAVLEFQLTSNVRLNNLSLLARHPLKQYLASGILCVQGTDGGALYGTDSIDEELALERLLGLSAEEMLAMKRAEDRVLEKSLACYRAKQSAFAALAGDQDAAAFFEERISREPQPANALLIGRGRLESQVCLADQVLDLPPDRVPVILLGGSFNTDSRSTRMQEGMRSLLAGLLEGLDPQKVFFVVGHRMLAYEADLAALSAGRFDLWAFVPTSLTPAEAGRLQKSGAKIRISIESSGMGLYKSLAYEIFKRRPSLVLALDGNSAGANVIQEARNGKKKARIFVSRHAPALYAKAQTLHGYTSIIEGAEDVPEILLAAGQIYAQISTPE